jgi:TonB family protein
MKKILTCTLSFILFCFAAANAQTTKVSNTDNDYNLSEKYYVLKADKSVKDGPYEAFGLYGGQSLTEGSYKNGRKDGLWKQYDGGHRLIEEGSYKDGQKIGIWSTYDWKGNLISQYDYTNSKLLSYKPAPPDTSKSFYVINGSNISLTNLDQPPIYLDGQQMALRVIMMNTRYPTQARANGVQGKVLVGFVIGTDGKTSDYRVVKPLGSGCDEEALSVVKKIKGDWLPGMLNGKPVAVEYIIPISFRGQ